MRLDKAPIGLLEQLRLRNLGEQPSEFSRELQGGVDVRDFYGADLLVTVQGVASVGALLNRNVIYTLLQPARVRGISATLTLGAAAATAGLYVEYGYIVRTTAVAAGLVIPVGSQVFGVAAATQTVGDGRETDIVLPAGAQIYARCGGTAAGVDHSLNVVALMEWYATNF